MQHVQLYYTYFDQPLAAKKFQSYLYTLPTDLQIKIQKFIRWQDQHASLFARLLLQCALQPYQYNLQQLRYTEYKRPFINQKIDFNLAHSGCYVLCAISPSGRVGIDIEQMRSIEIQHFRAILSENQWNAVKDNKNIALFFKFWTQKESVIKADGRGMYVELKQIEPLNNQVKLEQNTWFLHQITTFLPDYICYLATDKQKINVDLQFKTF